MKYYQEVNRTLFSVELKEATLETCTDVIYSIEDLNDVYNGGKDFNYWVESEDDVVFINDVIIYIKPIVRYIIDRTKEGKKVLWSDVIPFSVHANPTFNRYFLSLLKDKGISFSHTKHWFILYKPSKKPKRLYDGRALNMIKKEVVHCVLECINERFGSAMEQAGNRTKENKAGVVLLGKMLGITFEMAEQKNTKSFKKDIKRRFNPLSEDETEATYQELIKWFESIIPIEKLPQVTE